MYQNKDKCLPGTSADSAPCTRRQIFALFADDRALSVSNNKVYYVSGTSASVFRVPKTEKSRSGTFQHFKLSRGMYLDRENVKIGVSGPNVWLFQNRLMSRNAVQTVCGAHGFRLLCQIFKKAVHRFTRFLAS